MKFLSSLLLALLLTASASAQASSEPSPAPDIEVSKIGWHIEKFVPSLYDDPMRVNQEHSDLERDQKETLRQNVIRAQSGQLPLPLPTQKPSVSSGNSSTGYRYEALIKNTGLKIIRQVEWEYCFLDSNGSEVSHRLYTNKVNIRPGKTSRLIGRSTSAPAQVVQVTPSNELSKHSERVVIKRIDYEDGSSWQSPLN